MRNGRVWLAGAAVGVAVALGGAAGSTPEVVGPTLYTAAAPREAAADRAEADRARAIALEFLQAEPPLVGDASPEELGLAKAWRVDDLDVGPSVVLSTPRYSVRVALAEEAVVAFSRCGACLPLGSSGHLRCAYDQDAAVMPLAERVERAAAHAGRFPGARRTNGSSGSIGMHSTERRTFEVEEEPRDRVELVLDPATCEVTAFVRHLPPPVVAGEPRIAAPEALALALRAVLAKGPLDEGGTADDLALVTLRDPLTGAPRRFYLLRSVTGRDRHHGLCACLGGDRYTTYVCAEEGAVVVVRDR
ncbi:MAG: hypothetical protein KF878_17510 [Planctomycetes bacterium]|nr:hypothetical protein [Planctomycetota bacterium]